MSKRQKTTPNEKERDPINGGYLHAEKPTKNGHYMGKRCGFDYEDGRYKVASSHYAAMEEAAVLEFGLKTMMAAHNGYINSQFNKIADIRTRFWKHVQDDYELSGDLVYQGDGWISIRKPEEAKRSCIACGLDGFIGMEAVIKHQRECEQHPLGKEIRELREQLGKKTL